MRRSLGALFVLICLVSLPACFGTPPPPAATRYKILIATAGLYRITGPALQAAGADVGSINADTLQLFHADREVAIRIQGKGKDLTLDFYGEAVASPYSATSVYWLRWGVDKGKRMRESHAPPLSGAPSASFPGFIHLARPVLYIPQESGIDASWFWQSLTAPATTTVTVTLSAAIPGPAQLHLNLWGSTADPASPDHHVRVWMNDNPILDQTWDGQGVHPLDATIPENAVRAGENTLRLTAPGDTQAAADVVLLSSVEVTYTRRYLTQNDRLEFQQSGTSFRLEGFASDAVDVFDIADPADPIRVANATVSAHTVTLGTDSQAPRRWLAVGSKAYQTVLRIAPMPTTDLRSRVRGADYVVVAHPTLKEAVQPLVKWRADHGLKVAVATTDEIYDEFGYGEESPLAIRAFLDSLQSSPRFVLLVGKASYDYRDYLNGPNKNLLPTFLVSTPHLAQAASDNWFAAASASDVRPTFAMGRLPAKTPEQVKRAVDKIIAYESASRAADWRQRAIFVTDDKEPSFADMATQLATLLPSPQQAQTIALAAHGGDVKATRADLLARWNTGTGLLTYIGHGSIDTWAAGPLFSAENLGELKNADRLPILFTPTCLDGFFYHPQKDSLAEALLFKSDGGIIAGVVPTGLSLPDAQREFMSGLFTAMYQPSVATLGDAFRQAKQQMQADTPERREVIETFGLLGDPALGLGSVR